ncbi:MAG: PorT family protein [Bacteroidetes bacterium]|nr:PorT family protein [Bacteroidota bacterium]MBU1484519.1 PorT family protein [Bacteroidota bacterium]MBU2268572.1 PorT family protein [Bacteroidota bacterium]MBU2375331.1 PorT family protein [Bacteroidota bacterium]
MKKLILVIAAIAFSVGGFAQTNSSSKSKFGLKGGLNLPKYRYINSNNNTSNDTKTSTNFNLTGYADVPVSTMFSVQPGISIQGKGAKYFDNGTNQVEDNILVVEVPVNLLANLSAGPGHVYLGGGPYAGFNVSGKRKYITNSSTTDAKLNIGNKNGDDLKGLDFGLNLLLGYQLNTGLNFGVGYGFGLTNLKPTSTSNTNVQQNNRVASFTVGYAF